MSTQDIQDTIDITSATGEPPVNKPSRHATFFLITTAFLNTMGFGLFGPVLLFIVQPYVQNPRDLAATVGWLTASYAICQFLAAPGLGLLSDRFGRRPILLLCLLGSAIGYALFGIGGSLWVLFLGRIIDGLTGGNISILFAYVGDTIAPEERGKFFGRLGAILGVGFILGPAIGGLAAKLSLQTPVFLAAGITVANLIIGYLALPESLSHEHRATRVRLVDLNPFATLRNVLGIARLRSLLLVNFCYAFPFAVLLATMGVLAFDRLHWGPAALGLSSLGVGLTDIVVQGVIVQRLLPKLGEIKLAMIALSGMLVSYLLFSGIAFVASPLLLIVAIVLFAGSGGLAEPALAGLFSRAIDPRQQGAVQGGSQSIQALAQILGPLWGGLLYAKFGPEMPYWSNAVVIGIVLLLIALVVRHEVHSTAG
ncbi:MAG: MFS transporter [Ktedonobacterales bacterium]